MSPPPDDPGRDPRTGVGAILLVGTAGAALVALAWWQWPGPLALIAALLVSVSATALALWWSARSPTPPTPAPTPERDLAPPSSRLPDPVPGPDADPDPAVSRPEATPPGAEADAGLAADAGPAAGAPPAWAGGLDQALGLPEHPAPSDLDAEPEPEQPEPEPPAPASLTVPTDEHRPTTERPATERPPSEAAPAAPPAPVEVAPAPRAHRVLYGPPVPAGLLDPAAFGLTTRVLVDGARPGLPTYVPRDLDPGLDATLSAQLLAPSGGFVALRGQAASGLTRTVFEALRRTAAHRPVLAVAAPDDPTDLPLPHLLAEARAGAFDELPAPVVLVDDAHRHLGRGLTRDVVLDLSEALTGCTIVLTLSARRLQLPELAPEPTVAWLRRYAHPDALAPELSDAELARAFERFPARSLDGRLRWLPAWCSGADLLRTRYREWRTSHPLRAAVLTAAAAWQLTTDEPYLTGEQLHSLTQAALDGLGPTREVSNAEVDAEVEVLTRRGVDLPIAHTGDAEDWDAAALVVVDRQQNREQRPPATRRYATDAVLVEELAADPSRLTAELWTAIVRAAGTTRAAHVAQVAAAAGREQVAAHALELALRNPDPPAAARAAYALGLVLDRQQQSEPAAAAYRRAVAGADPDAAALAAFHLGGVLETLGQNTAAVDAYAIAVASGHRDAAPLAAFNLGWRHEQDRRSDEACAAYEQALASDHPDAAPMAAFNLAWLRQQQRRNVEAEQLYREAMASEHPDIAPMAGVSLGILLERLQRVREARTLFERIAAGAHDEAAQAARLRLQTTRRSATRRRR